MASATFVVPCWNAGEHLRPLLESLLAQTRRAERILVVDDASGDGSAERARALGGAEVEVIENPERLGIGANWNRCVELVDGEFVCLAHMDDVYAPDFLARSLQVLEAEPSAGAVHSLARAVDDTGQPLDAGPEAFKLGLWAGLDHHDRAAVYRRLLEGNFVACPSVVYRTSALRDAGGFDASLRFALDWQAHFALLAAGHDLLGIPEPLVGYRRHAASATSSLAQAPDRGLARFREELAVVRAARRLGVDAGLLPADLLDGPEPACPAVRNTLLHDAFLALERGDREAVAARLRFAREELPGGAADPLVRAFALAAGSGAAGRAVLRLGLWATLRRARGRARAYSM